MNSEHDSNIVVQQVKDHKFLAFILGSVVVALFLVMVALALYVSSGASQLDLSRPGYADIRKFAQDDDTYKGFPSEGSLTDEDLASFDRLYTEKLKEAHAVDAFGADVLSPDSLQINSQPDSGTQSP